MDFRAARWEQREQLKSVLGAVGRTRAVATGWREIIWLRELSRR